jgi:uncharacterized membrane protein YgcG
MTKPIREGLRAPTERKVSLAWIAALPHRLALLLALSSCLAIPAFAASPGPSARQALLGLGTCQGGDFDGDRCVDDADCDDGSGTPVECSTNSLPLELRGFLTIISDKDSGRFDSLETVPYDSIKTCADGPFQGDACAKNSDCRTPENDEPICREELLPQDFSKSTLTLILDFTKDGERFVFAETYQDLGDFSSEVPSIDCRGFCVPFWREPAVEPRIASPDEGGSGGAGGGGGGGGGSGTGGGGGGRAGGDGIRIQWAKAPPAIARAMLEALGLPEGVVPYLEVVTTTSIVDRSAEDDPLATVRTQKVTIRFLAE